MGREADEVWEQRRAHERHVARFQIALKDAVNFAIATLSDPNLTDHNARHTAFTALLLVEEKAKAQPIPRDLPPVEYPEGWSNDLRPTMAEIDAALISEEVAA
jgi:hypothetical protein